MSMQSLQSNSDDSILDYFHSLAINILSYTHNKTTCNNSVKYGNSSFSSTLVYDLLVCTCKVSLLFRAMLSYKYGRSDDFKPVRYNAESEATI